MEHSIIAKRVTVVKTAILHARNSEISSRIIVKAALAGQILPPE